MPDMDGFQVAEYIKEDPVLSGSVIMMLTSDDRKSAKERGRELGITDYLLKPIKWSDLKDTVTAAMSRKDATAQEDLSPLHILSVEDNDEYQMLIRSFLAKTPYTIDTAENGKIAVEKFATGKYDLVLMDIEMPVMDGYTAINKIRQWEAKNKIKTTPIIALTAHALVEHRQKSHDAGFTDHLAKPIKKANLLDAIKKYALKSKTESAT
jgi:CheY-like chemotaxis protein